MEILWIIALFLGLGMTLIAWNVGHYALRVISRTFGPLLCAAGTIGFVVTPMNWQLALIVLASIAFGGLTIWLAVVFFRLKG